MSRTALATCSRLTCSLALLLLSLHSIAADAQSLKAETPAPQRQAWWTERHDRTVSRLHQGQVDLLFIGDSITQGWEEDGRPVWDRYYAHRRAVNLGFNSDQTENVLWRLQHGELDGITPKLAIVMIGTNNATIREDPPEHTAVGIQAILTTLRMSLPETKILLLAIFPRSASADDPLRRVNDAVNERLSTFADQRRVFFLNLNRRFLDGGGRLSPEIMPDLLHPSALGYRLWAEGMEALVKQLLEES
ncbi:MAG: acetylglucosamine-6-sulfatase [Nitrospira sp. CR2.1]|nr:acetylglucosamine-6-sulfatase [Nitrospira sp. CR2.1]